MRNKRAYNADKGKVYFNGISTISRRNTVTDATDLAARLSTTLSELRDVMQQRKDQVEKLRDEITTIENQNEDLEKKIQDMIDSF
mgnify:CR=1 FL=1|tara:strand:+ start:1037 stop:1291 length:255 start_codon:yes stop_codon:yes gene_type:complete